MRKTLEFYFDLGSPAAYLAFTQLPRIVGETGAALAYRPMLLGGVFRLVGNDTPMAVPAKGLHLLADLGRFARRYGVSFTTCAAFPINTLSLMRVASALRMREDSRFLPYCATVYNASFARGLDLSQPEVLRAALDAAGLDAGALMNLAGDEQAKARLRRDTEAAVARGVFGAPTFFVGNEMFFGQDRLDFVREALVA